MMMMTSLPYVSSATSSYTRVAIEGTFMNKTQMTNHPGSVPVVNFSCSKWISLRRKKYHHCQPACCVLMFRGLWLIWKLKNGCTSPALIGLRIYGSKLKTPNSKCMAESSTLISSTWGARFATKVKDSASSATSVHAESLSMFDARWSSVWFFVRKKWISRWGLAIGSARFTAKNTLERARKWWAISKTNTFWRPKAIFCTPMITNMTRVLSRV